MSAWQSAGGTGDAGWRPDPTGRFEQRLWTGTRWTPRVRVGGAEAIESDTPAPSGDDDEWRPDPTGRFEQRLWHAGRWSRHIRVGDAEAVDILSVPSGRAPQRSDDPGGPGWRVDPADPSIERYWDGRDLTAKTRPAGARRETARFRWWRQPALVVAVVVTLAVIATVASLLWWLIG